MKKMADNCGFTLIEIIVSFVIITILGVIAGRGMIEMANGYMVSKKNATVAQQGQITVDRLKKEFSSIKSPSPSPSILCGGPQIITYTIQRSASEGVDISSIYLASVNTLSCQHPPCIFLKPASDCTACTGSCAGGYTLVENVYNFTLNYCTTPANCSSTYNPSLMQGTVSFVEFTLQLNGYGGAVISITNPNLNYPDVVFLGRELWPY